MANKRCPSYGLAEREGFERGVMRDGERIVCVLGGQLLKNADSILRNVPNERTIEIDPTIEAVENALGEI